MSGKLSCTVLRRSEGSNPLALVDFTDRAFTGVLEAKGVRISMDGKGRCIDNIFIERLWRSVKYEEVYLNEYGTLSDPRAGLAEYLESYNETRPHQSLDYMTPSEVYFASGEGDEPELSNTGAVLLKSAS
jgi:putative transposase